jgi:hypothetical protein
MKDLTIPVPYTSDDQIAEVELTLGDKKLHYSFRVESFPWEVQDELSDASDDHITLSLKRITRLKNAINNYDKDWELLQIFTPSEHATHIQVLYRKRLK